MIHEYDLLNALISGPHKLGEPIDPIGTALQGIVSFETPFNQLGEVLAQG